MVSQIQNGVAGTKWCRKLKAYMFLRFYSFHLEYKVTLNSLNLFTLLKHFSPSMAKQKNKKGRKAPRNARDIQTPVSDREKSYEPDAQKDESEHHSAQKSKSKKPDNKARFARSPTRQGDFAPNAGDYESNEESDTDLSDTSDINVPDEHQPDPLSRWVKEVIHRETSKESERMVEEFFTSSDPNYEACRNFFQNLNRHIREANQQNKVDDIDTGTVNEDGYNVLCQAWQQAASKAVADQSPEDFWLAFNDTRHILQSFNKRHHLPRDWNINNSWAEQLIGTPNPRVEDDTSSASSSQNDQPSPSQFDGSEIHTDESEVKVEEHEQTGLNALEARTIQHQRRLTSAKVLYWWPKGTGSQIFVRYGDRNTPIYRIRAGSHESYDPSKVARVYSTSTRGTKKVIGHRDGRPGEFWEYKREDVKDFLGIGWKVEDDNEDGLDPLNYLQPVKGATYPQTRTLVKWKDGATTLEGRSFIRRITTGSALDGDRVIYQKAKELETAHREKHGLGTFDDDYDDEDSEIDSDDSIGAKKSRSRRNHSEPAYYSRSTRRNATRRSKYETSEDSDTGSEISTNRHRRLRSEPAHRSKPSMGRGAPEGHQARIRQLEKEIQRLKIGRSTTSGDKRRKHRSARERTAS